MLDRRLRPAKARILAPATDRLATTPPLTLTGIGLVVGLGAAALAAAGWWLPALVAWLANRLADGLDGEVARRQGTTTDRGGYLDLVADTVVYAAVPLGVAAGLGTTGAWTVATILLATFYVNIATLTLLAAVLEKRGLGAATRGETTTTTLPDGLIEGFETAALFAVMLALPTLAVATMATMAALVALTAVGRVRAAWPLLDDGPSEPTSTPTAAGSRRSIALDDPGR